MQFYLTFFIFCHKCFDTPSASVMITMMENVIKIQNSISKKTFTKMKIGQSQTKKTL